MSSFKDLINSDLDVFMNLDEFAENHNINGRIIAIVIDKEELKKRQAKSEYGYEGDMLFYVNAEAYGESPVIGEIIVFDGDKYRVCDVQDDDGLYLIALAANLS